MRKKRADAKYKTDEERKASWYQRNRARARELNRAWLKARPGYKANSIRECYANYRRNAKKRGHDFLIALEEFKKFWRLPCYYCGTAIKAIGLDRINNDKGYIVSNLRPCCKHCNYAKRGLHEIEFIAICRRVASLHGVVAFNPEL